MKFYLPKSVQSGLMTLASFVFAGYENLVKTHPTPVEAIVSAVLALLFGLRHTSLPQTATNTGSTESAK